MSQYNFTQLERKGLLAVAQELAELRRCDHSEQRLRLERERWEAQQQEKRNKELEKQGEVVAAEAYVRVLVAEAKCQYEEKVRDGTLSPEEGAKFQRIFAIFAEWKRSHEALTPRFGRPFIYQSESKPIQPNQTNGSKTQ